MMFNELQANFDLNYLCFLKYLQLKSIVQKLISQGTILASDKDTDNKLEEIVKNRGRK